MRVILLSSMLLAGNVRPFQFEIRISKFEMEWQDSVQEAERLKELTSRIEEQISVLITKLDNAGKKDAAERLRDALKTLREGGVEFKVEDIIKKLSALQPKFESVLGEVEGLELIFHEILAILEGKQFDKEKYKKIKEIEKKIEELEALGKQQDKLIKEARDQSGRDYKEAAKQLDEVVKKQKELSDQTSEQYLNSMYDQLAQREKSIDELQQKQMGLSKKYEDFLTGSIRELADRIKELEDIEKKQESLKKDAEETFYRLQNSEDLNRSLKDIADMLGSKGKQGVEQAINSLENLSFFDSEGADQLLNELSKAYSRLNDQYNPPNDDDIRDIAGKLSEISDDFGKLHDKYSEEANQKKDEMAAIQDELADRMDSLARSLGKPNDENLKKAITGMSSAGESMKQSSESLSKSDFSKSSSRQERALSDMSRAKEAIKDALEDKMGRQSGDELEKLSEEQEQLSKEIGDEIGKLDELRNKSRTDGTKEALEKARDELKKAQNSSQGSSQSMQSNPAKSSSQQSQTSRRLSNAKNALNPSNMDREKEKDQYYDRLADEQKSLRNELEDTVRWLEKKKKDMENEEEKKNLAKSLENMKKASNQMQQSQKKLNSSDPSAEDEQQKAIDYVRRAKDDLLELFKEKMQETDKERDREMAEDQEKLQAITDELSRKIQPYSKASSESMQSASKNMERSKKHLQEGELPISEIEMQKAKENIDNAKKELKELVEEDLRQAQEETFTTLLEELKKIREEQKLIFEATESLSILYRQQMDDGEPFSRVKMIETKKLSKKQQTLAEKAMAIVALLEENRASAYSFYLGSIADDMELVATSLNDVDLTESNLALQRNIMERIEDLIEDLYRKLVLKPAQGGRQPPGQKPPLIDKLAELKLIYRLQNSLMNQTGYLLKKMKETEGEPSRLEKTLLEKLIERQAHLKILLEETTGELSGVENEEE